MIIPVKSMWLSWRRIHLVVTPRRLINLVKIYLSMMLSKMSGKQIIWGIAPIIMVEPTNICNLKCPMCPSGNGEMQRPVGQLTLDNFKSLLDEIGSQIWQVQLWNQGEPFINKEFLDFVRYARENGVMTLTSTNGHFIKTPEMAEDLIRSGLDTLIFSMDGTNQKTYETYRVGGKFETVMNSLQMITAAREKLKSATPIIELQFLLFKHNRNEVDEVKAIGKKYKVDRLSLKTAQVYTAEQAETYLPDAEEERRYTVDEGEFTMKGEAPNWCKRLWINSTVNWDGSVSPCCFDKDAKHAFDNIFSNGTTFKQTWKNDKYMAFRKQVMQGREQIDICRNCTEGLELPYTKIIEMKDL